ncbi:penicillin-binding protein, 1A family [Thermosyntropha lipolytica DSM 11003]|uniref:Penicillin-binding protein 1A n=1 Tax=Thermosyntropha lipolytica DSM 11003 TaxID=1123382 RepID=A0A1M5KTA9_9FIRM|nr:PBP1A family penicillin-binding protein [Thermosyntropha lipolytica]SHG56102.1 penicillin-binding protein, 1A family [Thermosyntropha lipolytica DSM 11003]
MRKYLAIFLLILLMVNMSGCALMLPGAEEPEPSVVYDINNRPIEGIATQNRINLNYDQIPLYFKQAVIAVEDKNFYKHHGIDLTGIIRAVWINVKAGKIVAGGSTITQQTAKNIYLSNERTFARKIKELYYTLQLERKYSKDEILTMYCNHVYFGHGAYGLEAAARTFFAKNASQLTLAEAALLAGLPQWPSHYDPYQNPEAAKKRQEIVLQRMWEEGYITEEEKNQALNEKLVFQKSPYISGEASYFMSLVEKYINKKYGERAMATGGLRIYTTLDLDLQRAANQAYQNVIKYKNPELQAALVAIDPQNGHIRALIGGRDFTTSPYNRVLAKRQPGSTFKPFMYSLAIASGFTAADMVMCDKVQFKMSDGTFYVPKDYGSIPYHNREFTLKEAVMKSDNVVAVKVNDMLNPKVVARYCERFGFKNIKPVLSLPLGSSEVTPLEMAAGYAVFASGGFYHEPVYILRIEDKRGRVLEENRSREKQVISAENAYIITNMLKGVLEPGGTGSHLKAIAGNNAAGKTGTTDEYRDAWFVGYTPRICCAVWVGYDDGRSVGLPGGSIAGPIWANFIGQASFKLGKGDFKKPSGVELVNICLDTGLIATEFCPRTSVTAFIKGTAPRDICYMHRYPEKTEEEETEPLIEEEESSGAEKETPQPETENNLPEANI